MKAAKETGWFRLEGGTFQEMDLPLHEAIAARVAKGEIIRVANADGGPWTEPASELPDVTPAEAAANTAALHEELSKALDRVAELEDELGKVTKERDELQASLLELKPAPAPADDATTPEAKPAKAAAKK